MEFYKKQANVLVVFLARTRFVIDFLKDLFIKDRR